MLKKSRFCHRLHRLSHFLLRLFYLPGKHLKDMAGVSDCRLDSFPLAVCDNIRISRPKTLTGEAFE